MWIEGVCENEEAHGWICLDSDRVGRRLLSAQPPETNVCRSPASVAFCVCEQSVCKAEASVVTGETKGILNFVISNFFSEDALWLVGVLFFF